MNINEQKPESKQVVVRIQIEGEVFYAEEGALLEEDDGLQYRGFGQWKQQRFTPVSLANIHQVQKDLRLLVRLPQSDQETKPSFCDVSSAEVNIDPFQLLSQDSPEQKVLWEYLPSTKAIKRVQLSEKQKKTIFNVLELALFE